MGPDIMHEKNFSDKILILCLLITFRTTTVKGILVQVS